MRVNSPGGLVLLAALTLAGVGLWAAPLAAQGTATVSGTVREAGSQRPLASVQVFIAGQGVGTTTSASGAYKLDGVQAGAVRIQAQAVGYATGTQTVQVTAGQTARADFSLAPAALALDELVVTGSGAPTERRKLGNTVASINTRELQNAPVANVSEVLQGREPGVLLLPSGGVAGEGARIRIRGNASLSQSLQPIIYVDGVRADNGGGFSGGVGSGGGSPSRLDDINPEAIERIEILKGAAAATLYGTEASKGVIQIFTKRGAAGAPRWSLEVEQGLTNYPVDRYKPLAGFARRQTQADSLSAFWGIPGLQPYQVFEVDAVPKIFETGNNQSYALSVGGGSEAMTYFVSGRVQGEDGPFTASYYGADDKSGLELVRDVNSKRQANANLTFFPSEKVKLRVNSLYTESATEIPNNNNNIYGPTTSTIRSKPEQASALNPTGDPAFTNIREVLHLLTEQGVRRFAGSLSLNYTPLPDLTLDATAGVDAVGQQDSYFMPFGWNTDGVSRNNTRGSRTVSNRNFRSATVDVKANWNRQIGQDLTSTLVVGVQGSSDETRVLSATGTEFAGPGLEVAGAGAQQTLDELRLQQVSGGLLSQEQLGFRNYLFLTLGARYDKHSAFGAHTGGALYPKAAVSFVPSAISAWNPALVSSLRLRAAIGRSGLQPGAFDKLTTYSPLASPSGAGVAPSNLGNENLKPEVSTEWETGAELGLWEDRVGLQVTYWNRTVDDLLVQRQFAPSGGFRRTQLDNIGQMKAWGTEIGLNARAFATRHASLDLFVNTSFIRETVTDLGGAPPIKIGYVRYRNWIKEGYAPGSFFGPELVQAQNPIDINGDGQPDSDAELLSFLSQPRSPDNIRVLLADEDGNGDKLDHYLGKPTPDWQGAFGGNFAFLNGFRIGTLWEYRFGNYFVQNLTGAFQRASAGTGRNMKQSAEVESVLLNPASTAEQRLDAARIWATKLAALTPQDGLGEIEPADFLRLRELSLTYGVPTSHLAFGVRSLDLTLAGRNLALFTKYHGVDPELNAIGLNGGGDQLTNNFLNGVDAWGFALPRRVSLTARVGF